MSVAHIVEGSERRRAAGTMLSEIVASIDKPIETRVSTGSIDADVPTTSTEEERFRYPNTGAGVSEGMSSDRTMVGVHAIDADGRIELDEEVFDKSELERGGSCLVVASAEGGINVMPVTTGFDPTPSGQ